MNLLLLFFEKKNQAKYNDNRKSVPQALTIVSGKMKSSSKIALGIWTFLFLGFSGIAQEASPENSHSNQGKVISIETALSVIRANEKKIKEQAGIVTWNMKHTEGKISGPENTVTIKPKDPILSGNHSVVYQPSTGKFKVSFKGIMPWTGGTDPYLAGETIEVYDGELLHSYKRIRPGKEIPPKQVSGEVSFKNVSPKIALQNKGILGQFYLYFLEDSFCNYINERNQSKEIISLYGIEGLWRIDCLPRPANQKKGTIHRIWYDPQKGVVTKLEFIGNPEIKTPWANKTWKVITIESKNFGGDLNLPVKISDYNLIDRFGSVAEFQDIKVKQNFPEDPFVLIYPPGTKIETP